MNEWQLYDLMNDKAELSNLYGQPRYQETVTRMKQMLLAARNKYDDHEPAGELH